MPIRRQHTKYIFAIVVLDLRYPFLAKSKPGRLSGNRLAFELRRIFHTE